MPPAHHEPTPASAPADHPPALAPIPTSPAVPCTDGDGATDTADTTGTAVVPGGRVPTAQPTVAAVCDAAWRAAQGLPDEAVVLIPSGPARPMRAPADAWGLHIIAADLSADTPDTPEAVEADTPVHPVLFAGCWLPGPGQPPADRHDGDVVARLLSPPATGGPAWQAAHATLELWTARDGRWHPAGRWPALGPAWPTVIAPAAATIMHLTAATDPPPAPAALSTPAASLLLTAPEAPTVTSSPLWRTGVMGDLLDAGLLRVGEVLVWDRRNLGEHHTATVEPDGTLRLANGTIHQTPSHAINAAGGYNQNGWTAWRRARDGRRLSELRAELQPRRTTTVPPSSPTPPG